MNDEREVAYALSIDAKIIDLGWPSTADTDSVAAKICTDRAEWKKTYVSPQSTRKWRQVNL